MTRFRLSALLLLILGADAFAIEPSGAAFLKIPNGTAEISLGMSGVSHANGGGAMYWNPARAGIGGNDLGLQFIRWLGDGRGTFGSVNLKTHWGGLSFYVFDLGLDDFEARIVPGDPDAKFTVHQSVAAAAVSVMTPFSSRIGVTVKGYIEDIYGDIASQFPLLDAGISWSGGRWSAGVMGANFMLNDRVDSPPPTTMRAGVSRKDLIGDFSLMDIAEVSLVRDLKPTAHFGLEAGYRDRLFLRGGTKISSDYVRPTFGIGLVSGPYRIDAALAVYDESLGSAWRFGLGYRL